MNRDIRLRATKYIWFAFAATMIVLLGTAGAFAGGLSASYVVLGVFISVAAIGATGIIWGTSDMTQADALSSTEKAKRDRIDNVLRDLSSEDLQRLKQRLEDGTINDDLLYEEMTISDDGELVKRGRKA